MERPTHRRATIRDVAARAGVATSTVSRSLSNPERVHRSPPLTTIASDLQLVGRTAVQLLLAIVSDPQRLPETVMLPTHLTIRFSTGPLG